MNKRIEKTFKGLKENKKKAFIPFLMSGYPNAEIFLKILKILSDAKCDMIEIGMPFTDPQADGPTIQMADVVALKNGTTVKSTLEAIKEFRLYDNKIPIIWMGYYNSLYKFGLKKFAEEAKYAGIDGILTVDLPPEENDIFSNILKETGINLIHLATPTTSKERLPIILDKASGFLYYVSVKGITGTKEADIEKIQEHVNYIKSQTDLPVCVGFGINTPQKVREIQKFADGAVVGSALIKKMAAMLDENDNIAVSENNFSEEIFNFISKFTDN